LDLSNGKSQLDGYEKSKLRRPFPVSSRK
jgi:hypothetical protein